MNLQVFLFAFLCFSATLFAKCPEGYRKFAKLPAEIGIAGQQGQAQYSLLCDTILVPENFTTVINAGTLLYFVRNSPDNLIRVKGTLILRGTKDNYVLLAGDREPFTAAWAGIEVDSGGRLDMEFAGFYGAANPIRVHSTGVKIVKSYFAGANGIVRPDGSLLEMDSQFTAINLVDFSKPGIIVDEGLHGAMTPQLFRLNEREKAAALARRRKGFWSQPKNMMMVGGGAVLVGGGSLILLLSGSSSSSSPAINPPMDPKPLLP